MFLMKKYYTSVMYILLIVISANSFCMYQSQIEKEQAKAC